MHSVSPVHVYVENHVKNPMIGTSIDETIKTLNKEKKKKKVKLAPTTNIKTKKSILNKANSRTRSFSPQDDNANPNTTPIDYLDINPTRWIPPPGKSSIRKKPSNKDNYHADLPERDHSHEPIKIPSCDVCEEAKLRSRSPSSAKYNSIENLKQQNNDTNNLNGSLTSSAASFSELLKQNRQQQQQIKKQLSRSLEDLNNQTYTIESDLNKRFNLKNQFPGGSILKHSLKNLNFERDEEPVLLESKLSNHEILIQKLIETEGVGNDIAKQLSALKDFLKINCNNESQISSLTVKRLENDRDMLLKNLETYENINRELKNVLYDLKEVEKSDYRRNLTNESLIKHIDGLEQENNHLKKLMLGLEKNVMVFGSENDQFKLENSALCNLKMSLENNRAHLQKQLNAKEAEVSRLNVKLRIAERKIERLRIELDELRNNTVKTGSEQSIKLNKNGKEGNNEKSIDEQTRSFIAKLQNEIKQKDVLIKELMLESKKFDSESQIKAKESGIDSLREISTARSKTSIDTAREKAKEEKLRNAESEISKLKAELEQKNFLLLKFKEENSKFQQEQNKEDEKEDEEIKRIKNFREIELDKVRAKLQQRLNELEPLPELLKNTELKLHESLRKTKELETRNLEQTRLINDLNIKIERLEVFSGDKERRNQDHNLTALSSIHNNNINNNNSGLHETVEKRLKTLEEENHDLFRQLSLKDEALRDANARLATKTSESSSLSRQLELALNDSKLKEDHIKDKYSSKERSLQARCIELETQLSKLKIDYNSLKRDREEADYKHQSQIKDLKDRLEQSYATNKSMQNYVNFLKNSYSTMFNDNMAMNNANGAYSLDNLLNKTGNTNLF